MRYAARMNRLALLVSCIAVVTACNKKNDAAKPGDKPGAAPAAAPAVGLAAPGNDAKIVELAKKALACKWDDQSAFSPFDAECADYKAWQDEKNAFAEHKGDATLVAFIEDPDEKVRYLGLKRLATDLGVLADKALAARVVAAAEKAKGPREGDPFGTLIGHTKVEDPELYPRIKALVASPNAPVNLRPAIVSNLLPTNPDSVEAFSITRDAVKDPSDSNMARTAMGAFGKLTTDKPERCDVFLENIENPAPDHAGDAAQWLTQPRMHCSAHYDAVLKSIDARVKAKKAGSAFFPIALAGVCDPKGGSKPPQVKTALGLAHKLAEDKALDAHVRAQAIEASFKCDPKGGKAYLGKFKKETNAEVKEMVAGLSKQKPKKK